MMPQTTEPPINTMMPITAITAAMIHRIVAFMFSPHFRTSLDDECLVMNRGEDEPDRDHNPTVTAASSTLGYWIASLRSRLHADACVR